MQQHPQFYAAVPQHRRRLIATFQYLQRNKTTNQPRPCIFIRRSYAPFIRNLHTVSFDGKAKNILTAAAAEASSELSRKRTRRALSDLSGTLHGEAGRFEWMMHKKRKQNRKSEFWVNSALP